MTGTGVEVDTIVVGGGIVGVSCAAALAESGLSVLLLERDRLDDGSSTGNAGQVVPSHVLPFAAPGMVAAGLRSLARRDRAFAVSTRSLPAALPWLAAFAAHCREGNVERLAPTLADLATRSRTLTEDLCARLGVTSWRASGMLHVHPEPGTLARHGEEAVVLERYGVTVHRLGSREVRDVEPAVHRSVAGGILFPDDARLDPLELLLAQARRARAAGAQLREGTAVESLRPDRGRAVVRLVGGRELRARRVVLAAGVWTPRLLRTLGVRLPLRPGRGHSVTLPDAVDLPRHALLLADAQIAVNGLENRLRLTGGFAITPRDRRPNPAFASRLVDDAARTITVAGDRRRAVVWSGLRPTTTDGAPVIGTVPGGPEVVVATGHCMLGTSLSTGTAEAVTSLVRGEPTEVDVSALGLERFARR